MWTSLPFLVEDIVLVYYCSTYFAAVTLFVVEMAMFVTDPTECVTYDGVDMRVDR